MVFVDFGRENWVSTEKPSFGRFWPEKVVLVDFYWKPGFDQRTGFGRFWPEKVVLVDFDRKDWFWPFLAEQLVLVDFCRE